MKLGDLVMFNNTKSRYAKWFYGQFAVVDSISYTLDGKTYSRVKWLQPVKYFDRVSTYSDFAADNFEVCNESR